MSRSFQGGLSKAEKRIDALLNLISSRLGLDHDRVLGSRYSFPVMARYLDARAGKLGDHRERDRLLYWYVHCFLWGRYTGSTETVLNQDLDAIEEKTVLSIGLSICFAEIGATCECVGTTS